MPTLFRDASSLARFAIALAEVAGGDPILAELVLMSPRPELGGRALLELLEQDGSGPVLAYLGARNRGQGVD